MLTLTAFNETRVLLEAIATKRVGTNDRDLILSISEAIEAIDCMRPVAKYLQDCASGAAPLSEASLYVSILDAAAIRALNSGDLPAEIIAGVTVAFQLEEEPLRIPARRIPPKHIKPTSRISERSRPKEWVGIQRRPAMFQHIAP